MSTYTKTDLNIILLTDKNIILNFADDTSKQTNTIPSLDLLSTVNENLCAEISSLSGNLCAEITSLTCDYNGKAQEDGYLSVITELKQEAGKITKIGSTMLVSSHIRDLKEFVENSIDSLSTNTLSVANQFVRNLKLNSGVITADFDNIISSDISGQLQQNQIENLSDSFELCYKKTGGGITGNVNISGSLSIDGELSITDNINVDKNAYINGKLTATDNVTFNKNASIISTLTVNDDAEFNKNVTINNKLTTDDAVINKDAYIYGNLTVRDDAVISSSTTIGGELSTGSGAKIGGNTSIGGWLCIDGLLSAIRDAKIDGQLSVGQLSVNGNLIQGNNSSCDNNILHSTALGVNAAVSSDFSFVWNSKPSNTYYNNGQGTFNIYPENGTSGVFIGYKSLDELLTDTKNYADNISALLYNNLSNNLTNDFNSKGLPLNLNLGYDINNNCISLSFNDYNGTSTILSIDSTEFIKGRTVNSIRVDNNNLDIIWKTKTLGDEVYTSVPLSVLDKVYQGDNGIVVTSTVSGCVISTTDEIVKYKDTIFNNLSHDLSDNINNLSNNFSNTITVLYERIDDVRVGKDDVARNLSSLSDDVFNKISVNLNNLCSDTTLLSNSTTLLNTSTTLISQDLNSLSTSLIDLIYPINSIYIDSNANTADECPIQLTLGGTWVLTELTAANMSFKLVNSEDTNNYNCRFWLRVS